MHKPIREILIDSRANVLTKSNWEPGLKIRIRRGKAGIVLNATPAWADKQIGMITKFNRNTATVCLEESGQSIRVDYADIEFCS